MTPHLICEYASLEQARAILCARDAYIQAMHPREWALKVQTRDPVTEDDYLAFLARNVLEWNAGERARLQSAIQTLNARLAEQQIPLVESIVFIKTTGNEEWNSWQAAWVDESPLCLDPQQVTGWPAMLDGAPDMELNPEEILAEQFAGLVTEEHELPLTEIRATLKAILSSWCN